MSARRSPIEVMADRVMKCVRCGAPMGGCDCWVKITLRCPKCKRTMQVTKDATNPPNTAIVEAPCDKCDRGGDKPETSYYNAKGQQIYGDTGEPITPARPSPSRVLP